MKVGFIGLGIMGRPMAKNLVKAGVELLVNDDFAKAAVEEVVAAGAKEATYAEIGAECERIILMVPSGDISKSILFAENGVASTIKPGAIVCDMSSVTPVESQECYNGLKEKGAGFLDAPVSGGEPGAINATLAIMAGGDKEDFDAFQEYFDILGNSAILIGPSGSGSVTKLANQIIVNNTIAVVSEAFVLAAKAGAIASGEFSTEKSVKEGRAFLVVVAEDASENTKKNFRDMAAYYKVPMYTYSNKEMLGHAIGKELRASIAVNNESFALNIEDKIKSTKKS